MVPDMEAGCSLADSCPADQFAQFVKEHPGHTVISYVNTTAAVKAVTDVVVTSTNARQIVESFPKDEKIIFRSGPESGKLYQLSYEQEYVALGRSLLCARTVLGGKDRGAENTASGSIGAGTSRMQKHGAETGRCGRVYSCTAEVCGEPPGEYVYRGYRIGYLA